MKKGRIGALIGLFAVICVVVGVLVWPEPKEAKAAMWSMQLTLEWFEQEAPIRRDVNATAQLFTAGLVAIGNPIELFPDDNFQEWRRSISDLGQNPAFVRFDWDYQPGGLDAGYEWASAPGPGLMVQVNTLGTHGTSQYWEVEP